MQFLVEHGASLNVKNRARHHAAGGGHVRFDGRQRPIRGAAGADSLGFEPPVELAHPSTVALLKKLGATE